MIPKALVVIGPWGDQFRWREAMHAGGLSYDGAYRAQNAYHGGVRIYGMPDSFEGLLDYSVVVLVNVDAPAIGGKRLEALRQFVSAGGGLMVLGGSWAYSRGGYADTPLAEMLPVTFPVENRIPAILEGLALKPGERATWPWQVAFAGGPRAFYVQATVPREQAVVELLAGDLPALVRGEFQKGRVVASGLTVHGVAPEKTIAFWDWPDWPKALGYAVDWAAGNRPLQPATPPPSLKPLTNEEIRNVQFSFQPVTDEFIARFAVSPTAPAATAIFDRVIAGDSRQVTLTPSAIEGLARFAKSDWTGPLVKAADALNPSVNLRSAALELLGAARAPGTADKLLPLTADADLGLAALDGLRRFGDPEQIPSLLRIYEKNLVQADFRHPDGKGVNAFAATRAGATAVHAAAALYALGERDGVGRMAGLYREIQLLRRIFVNATKRRVAETDTQGQAILKAIHEKRQDLSRLEIFLFDQAGPVPESQRASFITYANQATDDTEIRWLANAVILSSPASEWSALADASDGILRRLATAKSKP